VDAAQFPAWAKRLQDDLRSDVLVICEPLRDGLWDLVFAKVALMRRRAGVTVVLRTRGGSPRDAYRIGRDLRHAYPRVTVFAPSLCEGDGTLLLFAADEVVLTDRSELGPACARAMFECVREPSDAERRLRAFDSPTWPCTYYLDEVPWFLKGSPEPRYVARLAGKYTRAGTSR